MLDLACQQADDLSVLAKLTHLDTLYIREPVAELDPVALPNKDTTVYVPDARTAQRWRRWLGRPLESG